MDTERQLLQRIDQGDGRARHELYQRYAPTAMAVAMRYVADVDAARDVLQEAFVNVFTHVGRFSYRGEGSLKAWVMRIVSHEAIDWLRQQRHFCPERDIPDDTADEGAEPPDVDSVPMEVLQQMIARLPDGYRQVFCLYVFEEHSHKEIAALLGIRENSSASQFSRAKRLLAKAINQYKRQQA